MVLSLRAKLHQQFARDNIQSPPALTSAHPLDLLQTMSTKRRLPTKLGQPIVKQSAKPIGKGSLDESSAVVSGGGRPVKSGTSRLSKAIELDSDQSGQEEEEEEEDDEEIEEEEEEGVEDAEEDEEDASGKDLAMGDADALDKTPAEEEDEDNDESAEPAFGELVRANGLEQIDVAGAFETPESRALSYTPRQRTTATSVGTVLTQSLRTNDTALLESCLHNTDAKIIQATIERLESPLAGTLLQKLAERLHRRPGRAGSLMAWVQWTIIIHGGYLATQPDLIKRLAELHRVIDQRARSLQPLLSLKGKLDLLEAQLQLRKSMQHRNRGSDDEFEDDDEAVIYVEGQESDEDDGGVAVNGSMKRLTRRADADDLSGDESEQSEDMPLTNGMAAESEDEEEEDSDDEDLIDDEAEETDADTDDEADIDHDDLDSQGEEEESDDGAQAPPPTKMQRVNGMFSKRR